MKNTNIKTFSKFNEEVSLKDNPGIPGEGEGSEGEFSYISELERLGKEKMDFEALGLRRDMSNMELIIAANQKMLQLVNRSLVLSSNKEKELSKLAVDLVKNLYGDIVYGVDFDAEIVGNKKSKISNLAKSSKAAKPGQSPTNFPEKKQITDKNLLDGIYKSVIVNNIVQGEAFNILEIYNLDYVKNEIRKIFGDDAEEIIEIWNLRAKLQFISDKVVPSEMYQKLGYSEENFAGAVKATWKNLEDKKDEDKDYIEEILSDMKDGEVPSEENLEKLNDDIQELQPTIIAKAIDFPILLHELVKGIYDLIASISLPSLDSSEEEIEKANIIKYITSGLKNEPDYWFSGRELASDLRDFVNDNKYSDEYPQMRAYVFGKLVDPSYFSDDEFLMIFKGILVDRSIKNGVININDIEKKDELILLANKSRKIIDKLIDDIVFDLKEYERSKYDNDEYDDGDYESDEYSGGEEYMSGDYEGEEYGEVEGEYTEDEYGDYKDISELKGRDLIDFILNSINSGNYIKYSEILSEDQFKYLRREQKLGNLKKFSINKKNRQDFIDRSIEDGDFKSTEIYGLFLENKINYKF